MPVALAPLHRLITNNPASHATQPNAQYRLSMDNMRDLQPIRGDRELFADELYTNAIDLFLTIDFAELHRDREAVFRPFFR